jgi:hypothetical protein
MSSRAIINRAIASFCENNAIASFQLDDDGLACLRMADGRQVFLVHAAEDDRFFAMTELRKLPDDPELGLAFLQIAMGLNFLQQGTGPATLALKGRGLFCQCEVAIETMDANSLGLGMAVVVEQGKLIGAALAQMVRAHAESLADV